MPPPTSRLEFATACRYRTEATVVLKKSLEGGSIPIMTPGPQAPHSYVAAAAPI